MTSILAALIIPEEIPSLLAVLGLLFCWELHDVKVRQGRIQPKPLLAYLAPLRIELPTVGARPTLYLYMARNDSRTCRRCHAAHAHVFSGRTPWEAGARIRCEDCVGCRCVIIPLEGRWPVAKQLLNEVNIQRGPVQLSEQDIHALIRQGRGEKIAEHDHLALRLLSAMLLEATNPETALAWYSQARTQATEGPHTLIRAAAYIRSAEFLEQSGHSEDALQVTRNFIKEFTEKDRDSFLTKPQYDGMVARRNRLIRSLMCTPNTPATSLVTSH
jgi:hypothetical protein